MEVTLRVSSATLLLGDRWRGLYCYLRIHSSVGARAVPGCVPWSVPCHFAVLCRVTCHLVVFRVVFCVESRRCHKFLRAVVRRVCVVSRVMGRVGSCPPTLESHVLVASDVSCSVP